MTNESNVIRHQPGKETLSTLASRSVEAQAPRPSLRLMEIKVPPTVAEQRKEYGVEMDHRLVSLFLQKLPPSGREAFLSGDFTEDTVHQFDELIIEQAGIYSWRIWLSPIVLHRYASWSSMEKGPESVKRLHEAIEHRLLVSRGDVKGSVSNPDWYVSKQIGVPELRRLLRLFKDEFSTRRRPLTYQELCDWYRQKITADAFPFWHSNLDCLLTYFEHCRLDDQDRLRRIALGDVHAAELFDAIGAMSEGLSEVTFRQAVCRIASSKL